MEEHFYVFTSGFQLHRNKGKPEFMQWYLIVTNSLGFIMVQKWIELD